MWSAAHIEDERKPEPEPRTPGRIRARNWRERFIQRYGIFLAAMCLWTVSMILCGSIVHHTTERSVREQLGAEYEKRIAEEMEAYRREQAEAEQAAHWLSGDASREAAVNQATDAVAAVISKLSTDAQKLTEASCMLARVMSPSYPDSFEEVAAQAQQWMFFDGTDLTFSPHDRELAESIVRPYMESGIVPNGLTSEMVYGSWSPSDFVLRDSYETSTTMHTWRYQG